MFGILSYKYWFINPAYARALAPAIFRAIDNNALESFISKSREQQSKTIAALYNGIDSEVQKFYGEQPNYNIVTAKSGAKVAVVTMTGAITKNGDGCSFGMKDYQNTLAHITKNDAIKGIVFHFNNAPGGSSDGTPEMGTLLKGIPKNTVSFVDGYAASAHYWMASQTDHIMMNKLNPSEVGSIGMLVVWENIQNQIDSGKYPNIEIIRAPQSVNKALMNPIEPLTDELRAELLAEMSDGVKMFIGAVKSGRGAALANDPEMFTGKMYNTKDSIVKGLADSQGTLQDAINKAGSLVTEKSKGITARIATANKSHMSYPTLSTLFPAQGWSTVLEGMSADGLVAMEAAEKKAAEMVASISSLTRELEATASLKTVNENQAKKITELEVSVTGLQSQVTTLTNEKQEMQTKLDATPAGKATNIVENAKSLNKAGTNSWDAKAAAKVGTPKD